MLPMPVGDLHAISRELAETGRRVHVLWQEPETLLFVARGREYRSEFHINPSSEVMYSPPARSPGSRNDLGWAR